MQVFPFDQPLAETSHQVRLSLYPQNLTYHPPPPLRHQHQHHRAPPTHTHTHRSFPAPSPPGPYPIYRLPTATTNSYYSTLHLPTHYTLPLLRLSKLWPDFFLSTHSCVTKLYFDIITNKLTTTDIAGIAYNDKAAIAPFQGS